MAPHAGEGEGRGLRGGDKRKTGEDLIKQESADPVLLYGHEPPTPFTPHYQPGLEGGQLYSSLEVIALLGVLGNDRDCRMPKAKVDTYMRRPVGKG